MRLITLFLSGCVSAAMAAPPVPAVAAVDKCVAGKPTAASYTWDFKGETNRIFKDIQSDAQDALYHADKLQSFARDSQVAWEIHADQLNALKAEINDMGARLCRLEAIRRVVAPWQQAEIDRIATAVRLMADNAQDAILFASGHQAELWLGTYQKYTDNLYSEAQTLAHSVGNAVEYATASRQ